ncbi:MAG: AAA family ATPase [Syntrophales bacterium]
MLKKDLILRNPLRQMGYENDDILPEGGFGAVLARAGVGKTALLVQLSLNMMLRGKKVLHVSLLDPVNKVDLWYRELFRLLAVQYQIGQIRTLWEDILPLRFIMTFKVEGFSVPRLQERLNDLMEQGIFRPDMIIIDGLMFDDTSKPVLDALKEMIEKLGLRAWFTVNIHRQVKADADGLPKPLLPADELFDVALLLVTEGNEMHIRDLKTGDIPSPRPVLILDPATMLIKENVAVAS